MHATQDTTNTNRVHTVLLSYARLLLPQIAVSYYYLPLHWYFLPSTPSRKTLYFLPEPLPTLLQTPAHEYIRVLHGFLVCHPPPVPRPRRQLARSKMLLQKFPREPHHNPRLWRRIPVPALPRRIHSADRSRQSVLLSIQIQRPHFPIIPRQNPQPFPLIRRQPVPHLRHRSHKF